jgi:hypothetical protein
MKYQQNNGGGAAYGVMAWRVMAWHRSERKYRKKNIENISVKIISQRRQRISESNGSGNQRQQRMAIMA